MQTAAAELLIEDDGPVRRLRLNRPDRLNALTRAMLTDLLAAFEDFESRAALRVAVLTGSGRGFCAGGDLKAGLHQVTGKGPIDEQVRELRRFMRVVEVLVEGRKPVICAINGPCAGAGLALAAAADIRLASDTARFSTAFLSAGVPGDFGGTATLSAAVGAGRARELYLTGRRFDAVEAERIGLVSEIYPAAALGEAAEDLARRLASAPPLAVAAVKANFAGLPATLATVLDREADRHVACTNSVDASEAASAFQDGRAPRFVGG